MVPVGEAGVGLIQCPDDYLVLAGTRLCGDRFNDGSTDPQPTNSGPVTGKIINHTFNSGPVTGKIINHTFNSGPVIRKIKNYKIKSCRYK